MTGLLFLTFTFLLFLYFPYRLAGWILKKFKKGKYAGRKSLQFLLMAGILTMMFGDEIIGGLQFKALCRKNGIENADVSRAQGKRVKKIIESTRRLPWGIVHIIEYKNHFIDVDTRESLISYKSYLSDGGWFMRYTSLNMGNPKLIFFSRSCGNDIHAVFSENNIYWQTKE